MSSYLKGIGVGLKAAVESFGTTTSKFRAGETNIVCPLCGHDEFDRRSMLMNTSGMTMMNLDW